MLTRILHIYRMAGTLWLLWGHIIVACAVNPWLFKLVRLMPYWPDVEKVVDGETIMVPMIWRTNHPVDIFAVWLMTITAVTLLWFAFVGWSKFTTFWHNEKK